MQQWREYALDYKDKAGMAIAERFITAVEETLDFIRQNAYACPVYETGEGDEDLLAYQFRKWNLRGFPHMVLFRLKDSSTILIEVLYAHKMDIASRLRNDNKG